MSMSTQLERKIISKDDSVYLAAWMYLRGGVVFVVDEAERYIGSIGIIQLKKSYLIPNIPLVEIVNREYPHVLTEEIISNEEYKKAEALFETNPKVLDIPVINRQRKIIDILTRERVFFLRYYRERKLKKMHYAHNLIESVKEAKALGYKKVSAIEFGVAGGNGLLALESYAREVERVFGVVVETYGFDTGTGMPAQNEGYKDELHFWTEGVHPMDYNNLVKRLAGAKLIIGDIRETLHSFIDDYDPAPIACMCIDVDYYSSTVPILRWLNESDDRFLPRVYMYFDDVNDKYEYSGETLAIKEFNRDNNDKKICPEYTYGDDSKDKILHRFLHKQYNTKLYGNKDLSLR